MMRSFFLAGMLALSLSAHAKDDKSLAQANYFYTHNAFAQAIPLYEKVADELANPAVFARLGDCYRLTGNLPGAAAEFEKAVALPGYPDELPLQYGRVLMQLSRYADAKKVLEKYVAKHKGDRRAANLLKGCEAAPGRLAAVPSGTVSLAGFNSDGADFAPAIWKGKLVYASDTEISVSKKRSSGDGYYSLYALTCDNNGDCTGDVQPVSKGKAVNNGYHSGPATFTADGKFMYFTRSRQAGGKLKALTGNADSTDVLEAAVATDYDAAANQFMTVTPFQYNSAAYSVQHPAISPNGRFLVFASNMPKGAGGYDLYFCKRVSRDRWTKPASLGNTVNTEGNEVFPSWGDDRTIFFSSDGHAGLGGLDIYRSTWDSATSRITPPELLDIPVNSQYDDISLAMYADGRSTWLSSNRPAEKGGDNVFYFRRQSLCLRVRVIDSLTRQPVDGVRLTMASATHNAEATTGDNGVAVAAAWPGQLYSINLAKTAYAPASLSLGAISDKEVDTISRTVVMFSGGVLNYSDEIASTKRADASPSAPQPMATVSFAQVVGNTAQVDKIYEIGHIYFSYKSTDLTDTAHAILDSLASYLKQKPSMRIQVRAHTDCRGGSAYNMKLSADRAAAVVTYLTQKGIAAGRLEHKGFGDTMPVAPCPGGDCAKCTEEQHYRNRVLEFKVLHL